jgi:hypothetical protein
MEIIKDYYNLKNNKTKHNKLVKWDLKLIIWEKYKKNPEELVLAQFVTIALKRLVLDQPPDVRKEANPNILVSLSYLNWLQKTVMSEKMDKENMDIVNSVIWNNFKIDNLYNDIISYPPKWDLQIEKDKFWILIKDISNNQWMKDKLNTYMKYNWEPDSHWKTRLPRKLFYALSVLYMHEFVFKNRKDNIW